MLVILHLSIVTDVPREKAYHLKPRLLGKVIVFHNQQVESNGTVLSIDWKDVGAKKIESTLHDDLELKTWEI
ncbi:hypothetical protein HID58_034165 [Brassica napus]|uniref:SGS domain-containing protein n=1 Tax=Brassica napus TaxID=3708 RepID=A0ABQ8C1D1_BRANA|nr:hypothetical protein HID58_034165 [Brassica napus]